MVNKPVGRLISAEEVAKHTRPDDCWVVIEGQVWDVTSFYLDHPGGPELIYRCAGHDATNAFAEIHPLDTVSQILGEEKRIGYLDPQSVTDEWLKAPEQHEGKRRLTEEGEEKPPLNSILNAHDFKHVAAKTISPKAWAFYQSAAGDVITRDANKYFYNRIWLRPRVLRDVRTVSTKQNILGHECNMPLFVSPASMAKLIHEGGEKNIAKACESRGLMQGVSNYSSFSLKEITCAGPGTRYFFQLYVNKDHAKTEESLKQCSENPLVSGIFVTVDAAWPGKREEDERVKIGDEALSKLTKEAKGKNDGAGGGIGRLLAGGIDPSLTWETLHWLRGRTKLPLILKGVMTADDAILAMKAGMDGIYLSNHGGRNLDTSPPSILVLLEMHKRCPEVFDAMDVYIDGGIRRGVDILKALCLGATAVGMGRSVLFANNYGQEGIEKLFDIMKDELETSMRLVGITSLDQASPDLVNTNDIDHLVPTSATHPYARHVNRDKQRPQPSSRVSKL